MLSLLPLPRRVVKRRNQPIRCRCNQLDPTQRSTRREKRTSISLAFQPCLGGCFLGSARSLLPARPYNKPPPEAQDAHKAPHQHRQWESGSESERHCTALPLNSFGGRPGDRRRGSSCSSIEPPPPRRARPHVASNAAPFEVCPRRRRRRHRGREDGGLRGVDAQLRRRWRGRERGRGAAAGGGGDGVQVQEPGRREAEEEQAQQQHPRAQDRRAKHHQGASSCLRFLHPSPSSDFIKCTDQATEI